MLHVLRRMRLLSWAVHSAWPRDCIGAGRAFAAGHAVLAWMLSIAFQPRTKISRQRDDADERLLTFCYDRRDKRLGHGASSALDTVDGKTWLTTLARRSQVSLVRKIHRSMTRETQYYVPVASGEGLCISGDERTSFCGYQWEMSVGERRCRMIGKGRSLLR